MGVVGLNIFFVRDVIKGLIGGYAGSEIVYNVNLVVLVFRFLILRCPYIFGLVGFGYFLVVVIFSLFLGIIAVRVFRGGIDGFVADFIPSGTPLIIAPFVCCVERLRFFVRPFVLIIRPFLKLSAGRMMLLAAGGLCMEFSFFIFPLIIFLFLYEIFVCVVHWYIVCRILSFSLEA